MTRTLTHVYRQSIRVGVALYLPCRVVASHDDGMVTVRDLDGHRYRVNAEQVVARLESEVAA